MGTQVPMLYSAQLCYSLVRAEELSQGEVHTHQLRGEGAATSPLAPSPRRHRVGLASLVRLSCEAPCAPSPQELFHYVVRLRPDHMFTQPLPVAINMSFARWPKVRRTVRGGGEG